MWLERSKDKTYLLEYGPFEVWVDLDDDKPFFGVAKNEWYFTIFFGRLMGYYWQEKGYKTKEDAMRAAENKIKQDCKVFAEVSING